MGLPYMMLCCLLGPRAIPGPREFIRAHREVSQLARAGYKNSRDLRVAENSFIQAHAMFITKVKMTLKNPVFFGLRNAHFIFDSCSRRLQIVVMPKMILVFLFLCILSLCGYNFLNTNQLTLR